MYDLYDKINDNMIQHFSEVTFNEFGDQRGALVALEANQQVPFDIKRVYYIYNTGADVRRGCHAHKTLRQCLICVSGHCSVLVDDGKQKEVFHLDQPNKGVLIDGFIWRELYDFSNDAVVMVLASDHYENTTYIYSYDEFKELLK